MEADRGRALLTAALGFLQLRGQSPEVAPLRRWLDSWTGVGAIVTGMERQGYDVSLTRYPEGWRATFIRRDHTTRPGAGWLNGRGSRGPRNYVIGLRSSV